MLLTREAREGLLEVTSEVIEILRSRKPCGEDAGKEDCKGREEQVPGPEKGRSLAFLRSQTGLCAQNELTEQEVRGWEMSTHTGPCRPR